ncbi:MAG: hypothetical protein ACFFCQ_09805, partial [Promethearchaeota archaeon]
MSEIRLVARVELPDSGGIICAIYQKSKFQWEFELIRGNKIFFKKTVMNPDEDKLVDILTESEVEFIKFSAVYDAAGLLTDVIEHPEKYVNTVPAVDKLPTVEEEVAVPDLAQKEEEEKPISLGEQEIIAPTGGVVEEIPVPYSPNAKCIVSLAGADDWWISFYVDDTLTTDPMHLDEKSEDAIIDIVAASKIDFVSFSVVSDISEKIFDVVSHPEKYIQPDEEVVTEKGFTGVEELIKEAREEIDIDLSTLRGPKDVDTYIDVMRKSMNLDRPTLVKDVSVLGVKNILCHIHRQGEDKWLFSFSDVKTGEEVGRLKEVPELNLDEVAKVVNNGVPQISFSQLYDAAEAVLKEVERLAARPLDDLVINQAVKHFSEIIQEHEGTGEIKKAKKLAEALLDKFKDLNNPAGIAEFGSKIADYLEHLGKGSDAIKRRSELLSTLIKLNDIDVTISYANSAIEKLEEQGKAMEVANISAEVTDYLLEMKNIDDTKIAVEYVLKAVDAYQESKLLVALSDACMKYGEAILQVTSEIENQLGELTPIQAESLSEIRGEAIILFDTALKVSKERNDKFELLEGIDTVLRLLREFNFPDEITNFSEMAIDYYQWYEEKEKVLELCMDLAKRLLDPENQQKALEFASRAINIFYELNQIDEAMEFGFEIVDGLTEIEETDVAIQYIDFVRNVAIQQYEGKDPSKSLTIGLKCADRLINLRIYERAIEYIKNALDAEEDPQKKVNLCEKYAGQMIDAKNTKGAQDLANTAVEILYGANRHKESAEFSIRFYKILFEKEEYTLADQYVRYGASIYETLKDKEKEINTYLESYPLFIEKSQIDYGTGLAQAAVEILKAQGKFPKGVEILRNLVKLLIEKGTFDKAFQFIVQTGVLYESMGKLEDAADVLIEYRDHKEIIEKSLTNAKELNDLALKILIEKAQNYERGITVLEPFIEQLVNLSPDDAYYYIIQNAQYYQQREDNLGAVNSLEKFRDLLLEANRKEDSNKINTLTIKLAIDELSKGKAVAAEVEERYSDKLMKLSEFEDAAENTIQAAVHYTEIGAVGKATELLQRQLEEFYYKGAFEEAKKITTQLASLYVTAGRKIEAAAIYLSFAAKMLKQETTYYAHANEMINKAIKCLKPENLDKILSISQSYSEKLIQVDQLKDALPFIKENISALFMMQKADEAAQIAQKRIEEYLERKEIALSREISDIVLENNRETVMKGARSGVWFVKQLLERGLANDGRDYVEALLKFIKNNLGTSPQGFMASAMVSEVFASMVVDLNIALAREYAYRAGDHYSGVQDAVGIARVYGDLAEALPPADAIKALRKGIYIIRDLKLASLPPEFLELKAIMIEKGIHQKKSVADQIEALLMEIEQTDRIEIQYRSILRFIRAFVTISDYKQAGELLDKAGNLAKKITDILDFPDLLVQLHRAFVAALNEEKGSLCEALLQKFAPEKLVEEPEEVPIPEPIPVTPEVEPAPEIVSPPPPTAVPPPSEIEPAISPDLGIPPPETPKEISEPTEAPPLLSVLEELDTMIPEPPTKPEISPQEIKPRPQAPSLPSVEPTLDKIPSVPRKPTDEVIDIPEAPPMPSALEQFSIKKPDFSEVVDVPRPEPLPSSQEIASLTDLKEQVAREAPTDSVSSEMGLLDGLFKEPTQELSTLSKQATKKFSAIDSLLEKLDSPIGETLTTDTTALFDSEVKSEEKTIVSEKTAQPTVSAEEMVTDALDLLDGIGGQLGR